MVNKEPQYHFSDDGDCICDEELEILPNTLQNGPVLKDVHGLSNDNTQGIYKLAYDFYHHGKLNDAESLFRFLCIYDFYNPEYSLGLAAVYQLKKNYARAINFYALAWSLSEDDYRPMFYAGQCNLMLRRRIQARKCFERVVCRCRDSLLIEKANSYISELNKK